MKLKGIKNIYVNKKNQINKSQNRYNKNRSKQTIGNLKKNSINGHTNGKKIKANTVIYIQLRTKRNINKILCGLAMHSQYNRWIIRFRHSKMDSVSKEVIFFEIVREIATWYPFTETKARPIIFIKKIPRLFIVFYYTKYSTFYYFKWKFSV